MTGGPSASSAGTMTSSQPITDSSFGTSGANGYGFSGGASSGASAGGMTGMAKMIPGIGGMVGAGPGTGAVKGAMLGTQVMPGWGTLIGAAVGAGLGALGGGEPEPAKTTQTTYPQANEPLLPQDTPDPSAGLAQLTPEGGKSLFSSMFKPGMY